MPHAIAATPLGVTIMTDADIRREVRRGRKQVEGRPENQGYTFSHWQLRGIGTTQVSLQLRYRAPGTEDSYTTLWSMAL